MSDARRAVAAAAYALVGRNLHPRLRAGYGVRNFLARELSAGVAPSAQIGSGVMLSRGVVLKEGAGIGSETWFLGAGEVVLGRRLKMGPQCLFITNDHPVPPAGRSFEEQGGSQGAIIVGDDVFIGARATILPGVHIGDGAAIGAGAVVTKSVPDGGVAVGNPAKVIRVR